MRKSCYNKLIGQRLLVIFTCLPLTTILSLPVSICCHLFHVATCLQMLYIEYRLLVVNILILITCIELFN